MGSERTCYLWIFPKNVDLVLKYLFTHSFQMIFKLRNLIFYHIAWPSIDKVLIIVEAGSWVQRFFIISAFYVFESFHNKRYEIRDKTWSLFLKNWKKMEEKMKQCYVRWYFYSSKMFGNKTEVMVTLYCECTTSLMSNTVLFDYNLKKKTHKI